MKLDTPDALYFGAPDHGSKSWPIDDHAEAAIQDAAPIERDYSPPTEAERAQWRRTARLLRSP